MVWETKEEMRRAWEEEREGTLVGGILHEPEEDRLTFVCFHCRGEASGATEDDLHDAILHHVRTHTPFRDWGWCPLAKAVSPSSWIFPTRGNTGATCWGQVCP